jgi:hypothetical protein
MVRTTTEDYQSRLIHRVPKPRYDRDALDKFEDPRGNKDWHIDDFGHRYRAARAIRRFNKLRLYRPSFQLELPFGDGDEQ